MALPKSFPLAAAAALAVLAGAGQALAQGAQSSSVPVTVFDPWLEPYTAYGRSVAGGAVIVFEPGPLAHLMPHAAPIAPASGFAGTMPWVVSGTEPTEAKVRDIGGIYVIGTE